MIYKEWSKHDEARLDRLMQSSGDVEGVVRAAAELLGRTETAIRRKLCKMAARSYKLKIRSQGPNRWTAVEDDVLKRHYVGGGVEACRHLLAGRNPDEIRSRARRLGLITSWLPQHDAEIRRLYPAGGVSAVNEVYPDISPDLIEARAVAIGVARPSTLSDAQLNAVLQLAETHDPASIAAEVECSVEAVIKGICRLRAAGRIGRRAKWQKSDVRRASAKERAASEARAARRIIETEVDSDVEDFIRANDGLSDEALAEHFARAGEGGGLPTEDALGRYADWVRGVRASVAEKEAAGDVGPRDPRFALPMATARHAQPPWPTDAQPSTAEKVRIMTARVVAGYLPHHPKDVSATADFLDRAYSRVANAAGYKFYSRHRSA